MPVSECSFVLFVEKPIYPPLAEDNSLLVLKRFSQLNEMKGYITEITGIAREL